MAREIHQRDIVAIERIGEQVESFVPFPRIGFLDQSDLGHGAAFERRLDHPRIDDRIGQLQARHARRRIIRSDHQCLDLGMQRGRQKRRQKSQQGQENTTHRHGPKVSDQSRSDNPRLTPWLTRASLKSCTPVSGKNSTAR